MKICLALAAVLLLAACGGRQPLEPAPGQSLPIAPASAAVAPTTDELLTPPPLARPGRSDETLRRSEERADDRFDLPPS